jgi:hypothetical protein
MRQIDSPKLLTTRVRIGFAVCLTAFVLVQSVRGLRPHHQQPTWILGPPLLHGSAMIAANLALYAYIWWLAFWFVRGSTGRERFFMGGWFVGLVLQPLKILWPGSAVPISYIGAFGLAVALFAALALLRDSTPTDPSNITNAKSV